MTGLVLGLARTPHVTWQAWSRLLGILSSCNPQGETLPPRTTKWQPPYCNNEQCCWKQRVEGDWTHINCLHLFEEPAQHSQQLSGAWHCTHKVIEHMPGFTSPTGKHTQKGKNSFNIIRNGFNSVQQTKLSWPPCCQCGLFDLLSALHQVNKQCIMSSSGIFVCWVLPWPTQGSCPP